ncbi:MAG: hypothetical protein RLZZ77_149 [Bacteroidota bacterium]
MEELSSKKKGTMRILLSIVIALVCSVNVWAQRFEGMIQYTISYRSHTMSVPTDQLAPQWGSELKWYIKDGKYRKEYNGKKRSIEIYSNSNPTLEVYNPSTKRWTQTPTMISNMEIQEVEIVEASEVILGKTCNEIIFTTNQGLCRFFYPADLKMDAFSFSGHMIDCWFEYLNLTGAMPLKMIITTKERTMEAKAVSINRQTLKDSLFIRQN